VNGPAGIGERDTTPSPELPPHVRLAHRDRDPDNDCDDGDAGNELVRIAVALERLVELGEALVAAASTGPRPGPAPRSKPQPTAAHHQRVAELLRRRGVVP